MEDESLSSVDAFLRDNGFSISDPGVGLLSSDGGEEDGEEEDVEDVEDLLSDAPPTRSPSVRSAESPRFVLLEDADLLLGGREDAGQRLSGDRTSERREDDAAGTSREPQEAERDSLDRSMLFGGSGGAGLSPPPSAASSSSSSSFMLELQVGERDDASGYQMTPQTQEKRDLAMVSAASSASSSGRGLDDELNDALGVPRSFGGRGSSSSKESAGSGGRSSRASKTQRILFREEEVTSVQSSGDEEFTARLEHSSGETGSELHSGSGRLEVHEVEEKEDENDERIGQDAESDENCAVQDVDGEEGDWDGLNDLLRKSGLPAVRFRRVGSGDVLPNRDSLFSVIHDFNVQLERKNETIEDLVLASKRNSRLQSRREGELQTVEKKNEDTQRALEKARAEVQRLKNLQKKESENADLVTKKLKNSCIRLQQQLKVSEHRVKAKEVIVEKMQAKLQQQVDKENMNKTRDRRAFRNLQDRDPRRANPRDIQALETIGVYEAQREQMQEEIEHLKSQVAALNSELRDKDNFITRQGSSALRSEPPVWDQNSDEGRAERASGSQALFRYRPGSSSVASDEMMLEQLEAARREQEVAAAKLRHREAVMIKKVAMIEQELLVARETIGELKEENANLTLEAESRPSIRDYRLSQRRIHQLERQVAENKLALDEASDLNELRKYMGTKELVERDRLNHRLHLNRLNTLPRETTLEVVKHVCRVLHLTDITLISPSLDKLCSVVAAVPRMEKFIRDVCGFVFLHVNGNAEANDGGSAKFELEQVLPTLQQWMVERRKLHSLEGFKASIITELCKRTVEPGILNANEDGKDNQSPPSHPTTLSRAVHIVSELVELEKSVMHHREIYTQAAVEVERRPNVLINQIVRHFSHLFQVKRIEGVLPKINETYLFVNEMKNFLHAVSDLLHLKEDSSLVHCLNAIRDRLQEDAANPDQAQKSDKNDASVTNQENVYRGNNAPNFVVERRRSQSSGNVSHNEADLVGIRQVREMSILVRALKRELGAASMEEILPRTKRLMELLSLSIHNADPERDEEYE